jgi:outer membrane protein OmpA-like peptidoglycan-associated protein
MKRSSIRREVLATLAVAGMFAVPQASIAAVGDWIPGGEWIVRAGAGMSDPQGDTKVSVPDGTDGDFAKLSLKEDTQFVGDVTWMFNRNWGLELFGSSPFKHDVKVKSSIDPDFGVGGGSIGDVEMIPWTLSLQYHFLPDSFVRPYLGIGGTYGYVDGDDPGFVDFDDDYGFGGGAGIDFGPADGRWLFNVAVKYIDLDLKYRANYQGGKLRGESVAIDPLIYSASVGYRFGKKEKAAPAPVAAPPPPPPPKAAPPPPPPAPKDSDGDGVYDDKDRCPNTTPGVKVDAIGCFTEVTLNLLFEFDSAALTDADKRQLDAALSNLRNFPPDIIGQIRVNIAGHTDSRGAEAYNQGLSERRAASVREYLAAGGFPGGQMSTVGFGETQPVATNDTDEGRAQNRRVVITAER